MEVPPSLSLCMIVRDEAEHLSRCLDSVRGVVDEIVVVDTGSVDATREIAARHGARVASFDWCDDFAAARNASLALASRDWILVMDADEVLLPGSGEHLQAAMHGAHGAYLLDLENLTGDGDGERQALRLLRLFRNHPEVRYQGRVHEQVTANLERLGLTVGTCPARLVHDGYLAERMAVRSKQARNIALLEAMCAEEPQNPYAAYHLGKTLMAADRGEDAQVAFTAALALLEPEPQPERVPYYATLFMLQAALVEGRDGIAAAHGLVQQGLRRLPKAAKLWHEAGRLLNLLGRLDEALEAYALCFDLAEHDASPEAARVPERAAAGAAEVLMGLGRTAEALDCLAQSAELAPPGAFEPWLRLAVALMQAGRMAEAREAYEAVVALRPQEASAQLALATLYFEAGAYPRALAALEAVEALIPGRPDVAFLRTQCQRLS